MKTHSIIDDEGNIIFIGTYSQCLSRVDKTGAECIRPLSVEQSDEQVDQLKDYYNHENENYPI